MDCAQARMHFALLLYGELSFDEEESVETHLDGCAECKAELERQKSLHAALEELQTEPAPALLRECRAELAAALRDLPAAAARPAAQGWRNRFMDLLDTYTLRPAGAVALIALGFFVAEMVPYLREAVSGPGAANSVAMARVSDIEAEPNGAVRIVLDETRQRAITGTLDDQKVRSLLLEAAQDTNNPGLRADSVDLLKDRAQSAEIRTVLVYMMGHDQNDGVRMKAMEGLRPYSAEPEVRGALRRVLLSDANPGLRTQAIELLLQPSRGDALPSLDRTMVGTLQELMLRERNESVRARCQRALQAVNASAEIY